MDFTEDLAQLNPYVLLRALICLEGLDLTWYLHPQPLFRSSLKLSHEPSILT